MVEMSEQNPLKLNLACGQNHLDGYLNVDLIKTDACDKQVNLEKYPWPFQNDSVDEVYCSHYVEHTSDLITFMDEICRILKKDGKATIIAPYYSSMRAWQDPTHKRAISEATFMYFNKGWREQNKLDHYNIKSDFDFNYGYMIDPLWASKNEETRAFAIAHYINIVTDIQITLTKK